MARKVRLMTVLEVKTQMSHNTIKPIGLLADAKLTLNCVTDTTIFVHDSFLALFFSFAVT